MSDITPLVDAGSQVIHSYGSGGFTISGERYDGSVLIVPSQTLSWPVSTMTDITFETFRPILAEDIKPEILFLGCGASIAPLDKDLRQSLRAEGVVVELMDTGAACRTYNITMTEGRRIAAALIALT